MRSTRNYSRKRRGLRKSMRGGRKSLRRNSRKSLRRNSRKSLRRNSRKSLRRNSRKSLRGGSNPNDSILGFYEVVNGKKLPHPDIGLTNSSFWVGETFKIKIMPNEKMIVKLIEINGDNYKFKITALKIDSIDLSLKHFKPWMPARHAPETQNLDYEHNCTKGEFESATQKYVDPEVKL